MNLKLEKIYKNMPFHNIIAHPTMQFLNFLGMHYHANLVHDNTLPENRQLERFKEKIANTNLDIPEANRVLQEDSNNDQEQK